MEHGSVGLLISTAACSLVLAPALATARNGGRRNAVLLAVTLALAIVAGQGYLQIALFVGILPLYALFFFDGEGHLQLTWRTYVLGIGLSLLLAGIFLVPLAHFWPQFGKDLDPYFQDLQPLAYIPLNFFIADPEFYQYQVLGKKPWGYLYINYVGWIPALLAIAAVRLMPKARARMLWFLGLGILVPILMAAGLPFRWLASVLPAAMTSMRSVPVVAGLAVPFLLALAAWGLEELMDRDWPVLSFEGGSGQRRMGLNLMPFFVAVVWFFSLLAVYEFSRAWLRTEPVPDHSYQVVDAARTPTAQWVAMPLGEHFWAPIAAEKGIKLTNVTRPSHWRNREPPPPYVSAVRYEPAGGTLLATLEDVRVVRLEENPYAYVQAGSERVPCEARAQGGQIDVKCEASVEGTLIVRENSWSGWRAWRDGVRRPLERSGPWLSLRAPAGQHEYRFRYVPWDVGLGALVSVVGLLVAAALWWPGLEQRLQRRAQTAPEPQPGPPLGGPSPQ
jgi:hypothetical protein